MVDLCAISWEISVSEQLYFAYGSNLSPEAMKARFSSARALGKARAPERRLRFSRRSIKTGTGVADIVLASGFSTWGMLYSIEDDDLLDLDRKEGLLLPAPAYQRFDILVLAGGIERLAVSYRVLEPEPEEVAPSHEYMTNPGYSSGVVS